MNRRGFFATLLAPVVAKCLPKPRATDTSFGYAPIFDRKAAVKEAIRRYPHRFVNNRIVDHLPEMPEYVSAYIRHVEKELGRSHADL